MMNNPDVHAIISCFSKSVIKAIRAEEDPNHYESKIALYAFAHQYFEELAAEHSEMMAMRLAEEDVAHLVSQMRPQFGLHMTPRDVQDTLEGLDMNATATVELCKLSLEVGVDAINALHVAAFAVALVPSASLFDTLRMAMGMFSSSEIVVVVAAPQPTSIVSHNREAADSRP